VTDDALYNHLITSHPPLKICQNDCVSTCKHVKEYKLHNQIVTNRVDPYISRYNVNIDDLLYSALDYPEKEILKRVDDAINKSPNDPGVYRIPNDVWTMIFPYLPIETRLCMSAVCKKFDEIAQALKNDTDTLAHYLGRIEPARDKLCATLAKQVYYLTDKDLGALQCSYHQNPHYRSSASMKMYTKSDLIETALKKHKTIDAWIQRVEKKKNVTRQLANVKIQRNTDLTTELNKYGLEFRYDSRVCNHYILHGYGPHGENLQGVIDIMIEMNWYFDNTSYRDVFGDIIHEYKEDGEWYNVNDVSYEAKVRVVRQYKREGLPIENLPRNVRELYDRLS
jgi:hypothetical protein